MRRPVLLRREAIRSGKKTRHHLGKGSQAMKSEVLLFPQPALQLIYDTAPIGLACLSPDCRYLQINQRLTEICGISVEGHLGRTVRDCVPALADSVEAIVRSIVATGEPVVGIEVAGQRFDQAQLLARVAVREAAVGARPRLAPDLLRRRRWTGSQSGLRAQERRGNVRQAFDIHPRWMAEVAGKTVLLVDDVLTTGATVEACTRVLQRGGARHVDVLTLARVVRPAV